MAAMSSSDSPQMDTDALFLSGNPSLDTLHLQASPSMRFCTPETVMVTTMVFFVKLCAISPPAYASRRIEGVTSCVIHREQDSCSIRR